MFPSWIFSHCLLYPLIFVSRREKRFFNVFRRRRKNVGCKWRHAYWKWNDTNLPEVLAVFVDGHDLDLSHEVLGDVGNVQAVDEVLFGQLELSALLDLLLVQIPAKKSWASKEIVDRKQQRL